MQENNGNGWKEWSKYVLKELERLNDCYYNLNTKYNDLDKKLDEIHIKFTELDTKFSEKSRNIAMWTGGIVSIVVSIVTAIILNVVK